MIGSQQIISLKSGLVIWIESLFRPLCASCWSRGWS